MEVPFGWVPPGVMVKPRAEKPPGEDLHQVSDDDSSMAMIIWGAEMSGVTNGKWLIGNGVATPIYGGAQTGRPRSSDDKL